MGKVLRGSRQFSRFVHEREASLVSGSAFATADAATGLNLNWAVASVSSVLGM